MLNRCEFIGNLGRDPEVKNTAGGRVVSFSLAVSEKWTDKSGERKEKTTWIPIVIWNDNIGEVAERYLRKGSKVYVAGSFATRKWTGSDGQDKYATEVVLQKFRGELMLLDGREGGGGDTYAGSPALSGRGSKPAATDAFDDTIPF